MNLNVDMFDHSLCVYFEIFQGAGVKYLLSSLRNESNDRESGSGPYAVGSSAEIQLEHCSIAIKALPGKHCQQNSASALPVEHCQQNTVSRTLPAEHCQQSIAKWLDMSY